MWLQATFTREDIATFLDAFFPLRVVLEGGKRKLFLGKPDAVELVPGRGLRVVAHGRVLWPVLGVTVPVSVPAVRILLEPRIETREDPSGTHDVLAFHLQVEDLDVKNVPGVVETPVVNLINADLEKNGAVFAWKFTDTLSFKFPLPQSLAPANAIELAAKWGEARIAEEGLTLAVSFRADVNKSARIYAVEPPQESAPLSH